MKTLEDVKRAAELAVKREELLHEAALAAKADPVTGFLYGVVLDRGMSVAARDAVAAELRRRAGECEASLRELGVVSTGDPVLEIDPGPKHAFLRPGSWSPETGEFTVWVPCTPARSWRRSGVPAIPTSRSTRP